jgi:trigger factor
LDDDFAQQLGAQDAEDLRKGVRESLMQQKQQTYDVEYLTAVLDEIVSQATLKYPPQLVEDEVMERLGEYRREAQQRGLSWEDYLKERGTDEEALKAEIREEVEPFVRRRLVLETIAREENLEIDTDKVMDAARNYLLQMAASMDLKEARKLGRDKALVRELLTAAAHDELMEQAEAFVISLAKGELEAKEAQETAEEGEASAEEGEAEAATAPEAQESESATEEETEAASEPEAAETASPEDDAPQA